MRLTHVPAVKLALECTVCRQLRDPDITQEQVVAMIECGDPRTTCPLCGQDTTHCWQNRTYQQRASALRWRQRQLLT